MKKKDLKTYAHLDEADAIFDGQTKIDILEAYQDTQFYKRFYDVAKKQLDTQLKPYKSKKQLSIPENEAFTNTVNKILDKLYSNTGVKHRYTKIANEWHLSIFFSLPNKPYPLINTAGSDDKRYLSTLEFDLSTSITDQLTRAEIILNNERRRINKTDPNKRTGSSRLDINEILEWLEIKILRDDMEEQGKTWDETAKQLDININTAKSKYNKAHKLLFPNLDIIKYLPDSIK